MDENILWWKQYGWMKTFCTWQFLSGNYAWNAAKWYNGIRNTRSKRLYPKGANLVTNNKYVVHRSSPSEVFLRKGVLKICSKFTGEHPCGSVISIKLQNRTLTWVFSFKFATYFQNIFSQEHLWRAASVCSKLKYYGACSYLGTNEEKKFFIIQIIDKYQNFKRQFNRSWSLLGHFFIPTNWRRIGKYFSDTSLFQQFHFPTILYSDKSLFSHYHTSVIFLPEKHGNNLLSD